MSTPLGPESHRLGESARTLAGTLAESKVATFPPSFSSG